MYKAVNGMTQKKAQIFFFTQVECANSGIKRARTIKGRNAQKKIIRRCQRDFMGY